MTESDLSALESLCLSASPGPWEAAAGWGVVLGPDGRVVARTYPPGPPDGRTGEQVRADAAFVAGARAGLPVLLGEVRRLRAVLERVALSTCCVSGYQVGYRMLHAVSREAGEALGWWGEGASAPSPNPPAGGDPPPPDAPQAEEETR